MKLTVLAVSLALACAFTSAEARPRHRAHGSGSDRLASGQVIVHPNQSALTHALISPATNVLPDLARRCYGVGLFHIQSV